MPSHSALGRAIFPVDPLNGMSRKVGTQRQHGSFTLPTGTSASVAIVRAPIGFSRELRASYTGETLRHRRGLQWAQP